MALLLGYGRDVFELAVSDEDDDGDGDVDGRRGGCLRTNAKAKASVRAKARAKAGVKARAKAKAKAKDKAGTKAKAKAKVHTKVRPKGHAAEEGVINCVGELSQRSEVMTAKVLTKV